MGQFAGGVRVVAKSPKEPFADCQVLSRVHEGAPDVGAMTYSKFNRI